MIETMKIRRIQPQDRPGLKTLLQAQPHFHPEEIRVALELIDIALAHPAEEDYIILCAEEGEGEIRGYICYGKAPLTEAVYDVYWIVVHPECWGQGTGSSLLRRAEVTVMDRIEGPPKKADSFHRRICPEPETMYFRAVRSSTPMGPNE